MPAALMSAEELLQLNLPNKRAELVRGVLAVREPAGFRHGAVAVAMTVAIGNFVHAHRLGIVVAAETGFTLRRDPDTVRAPDVAFVTTDRCPAPDTHGFAELAPDLVVEVLSPDDRAGEVLSKVGDWLSAGGRLVWVLDPVQKVARVFRADGSVTLVGEHDVLDGEDVLPCFACGLSSVVA